MELQVNIASFEEGFELQRAVIDALRKIDFRLERIIDEGNFSELFKNIITGMALSYISDPSVQKSLWVCLGRCLYNGKRITKETFEGEDTRKDFIPAAVKCVEVNLEPFTGGLLSAWKLVAPAPAENSPK